MSSPFDINPYAPPKADDGAHANAKPAYRQRRRGGGVEEAIERLRAHVADAEAMAADRAKIGARIRRVGLGCAVVAGAGGLGAIGFAQASHMEWCAGLSGLVAGVAFVIAIIVIPMDLSLVPREAPATPEATLKSFIKGIAMGRSGYAWATLCPSAREQAVATPELAPVETSPGEFSLATEDGFKAYVTSFARSVAGTMRTMSAKAYRVREVDGEVARVDVDLVFQSWPQWVSFVMAVGAAIFLPAIVIGVILFFVMRKTRKVTTTKTLLKASTGAWYVYDGELLEGATDG